MRNLLSFTLLALIGLLMSCGGKSPEEIKKEKDDSLKTAATRAVKDLFGLLEKQDFEKIKAKIEPASLPNLQIIIAEAEKYKAENKIREPIVCEVLEVIIVSPEKVNCKTKCKIKDKEIIEIIPVNFAKNKDCKIILEPVHLKVCRFIVFCNRYDIIVIEYNKKYYKEKKKKKDPKGKAHGYKRKHKNDDDDDDDNDDDD